RQSPAQLDLVTNISRSAFTGYPPQNSVGPTGVSQLVLKVRIPKRVPNASLPRRGILPNSPFLKLGRRTRRKPNSTQFLTGQRPRDIPKTKIVEHRSVALPIRHFRDGLIAIVANPASILALEALVESRGIQCFEKFLFRFTRSIAVPQFPQEQFQMQEVSGEY